MLRQSHSKKDSQRLCRIAGWRILRWGRHLALFRGQSGRWTKEGAHWPLKLIICHHFLSVSEDSEPYDMESCCRLHYGAKSRGYYTGLTYIRNLLKKIHHTVSWIISRKVNILDNMVARLEKYASNLEEIVAQRTGQLLEEKKKTDTLLYRMLPQYTIFHIDL